LYELAEVGVHNRPNEGILDAVPVERAEEFNYKVHLLTNDISRGERTIWKLVQQHQIEVDEIQYIVTVP
jgi:hypothetical protein